jgi:hypothetical protein
VLFGCAGVWSRQALVAGLEWRCGRVVCCGGRWVNCSRSSFRHVWSVAVDVGGGPWNIHPLVDVSADGGLVVVS